MNTLSISTKELREQLPRVRTGLAQGNQYVLIYRSKPIARLEPIEQVMPTFSKKIRGGTLRLQANSAKKLTPDYLNQLAASIYE